MSLYDWTIGFLLGRPWYSLLSLVLTFGAGYLLFRYDPRRSLVQKCLALLSLYSAFVAFFILTSAVIVGRFVWPPSGAERFLLFVGAFLLLFEVCSLTLQGTPLGTKLEAIRSRHLTPNRPIPASHPIAPHVSRIEDIQTRINESNGESLARERQEFLEVKTAIETQLEPLDTPDNLETRIEIFAQECQEQFEECIEHGEGIGELAASLAQYKGTVSNIPIRLYDGAD